MCLSRIDRSVCSGLCTLVLLFLSWVAWAAAAEPAGPIDDSKDGVYQSGLWRYEFSVSSPGSKSQGYHGKLLYNGVVLPPPAQTNDYYQTPWGPMYWVGQPVVLWGSHGWMSNPLVRAPVGQALPVPSDEGTLIVRVKTLTPEPLGTPDRLEKTDWVLAALKDFGADEGHVQADWYRLGAQPVTFHDTKRWGTAHIRLADTKPGKPFAVEIIGRGTLLLTPAPPEGAPGDSTLSRLNLNPTHTVELPRQVGATRLVKFTLNNFIDNLEMFLVFRVESLGKVLVIGPEANGKTVAVRDFDAIAIRLPGLASSGQTWAVASVDGKAVEPLGGVEYEPDTTNALRAALQGTFVALFRVQQKGRATVALNYRPLAAEGKKAAKSFRVRLDVQSSATGASAEAPAKTVSGSQKSRR